MSVHEREVLRGSAQQAGGDDDRGRIRNRLAERNPQKSALQGDREHAATHAEHAGDQTGRNGHVRCESPRDASGGVTRRAVVEFAYGCSSLGARHPKQVYGCDDDQERSERDSKVGLTASAKHR